MSIWSDMQDRSAGISVRKDDIRRANWTVRITNTESFASYDRIRLTPALVMNWEEGKMERFDGNE